MKLPDNLLRPSQDLWQQGPPCAGPFGERYLVLEPAHEASRLTQIGANTVEFLPGMSCCPLHLHHFEEEHFLVLEGTLTVRELPRGAYAYREFELTPGELVAYPAGTGLAHRFYNRTDAPVRYLAVSDHNPHEVCEYPDSGKTMLRGLARAGVFGDTDPTAHLAAANAAAWARPVDTYESGDRPDHITGPTRLHQRDMGGPHGRPLSRAAGARAVFVNQDRLPPGTRTAPLHAHTADDELVYVLTGHPTLHQLQGQKTPGALPTWPATPPATTPLQPGDSVYWPAGTPTAHHLTNDTPDDVQLLTIGTHRPEDITIFPDSNIYAPRALNQRARFHPTDYFAGETR